MKVEKLSFSSLELYSRCSQAFKEKYITKSEVIPTFEEALLLGTLTHELIERRIEYKENVTEAFRDVCEEWLKETCQTKVDPDALLEYVVPVSRLYRRAMPYYVQKDKIRNKDGTTIKDPLNYPSAEFKKEYNNLDISHLKSSIDQESTTNNPQLARLSIANIAATAVTLAQFPIPRWVSKTVACELPFSVEVDGQGYRGFIDWIVENDAGELVIIDHKTSSKKPKGNDVLWHPQLLFYVYMYMQETGKFIEYIGINHLRSGEIIVAQVDMSILDQVIKHLDSIKISIDNGNFQKHYPLEYNSPCICYDFRTEQVNKICPYLLNCWPDYVKDNKNYLLNYDL